MRIYLDNCCYNRPYDDQTQLRISLETQAKLYTQNLIRTGMLELVSSYVLRYEIALNPNIKARESITEFVSQFSSVYVGNGNSHDILDVANTIQSTGIKKMDALHVSCAIFASSDYFISTDKRLLKYQTNKLKLVTPIEFISIWEDIQ